MNPLCYRAWDGRLSLFPVASPLKALKLWKPAEPDEYEASFPHTIRSRGYSAIGA